MAPGNVPMGAVFNWICDFARDGIWADTDYSGKSLKSMMKRADKDGAKYVLIAGESEFDRETAILKNMATGEQEEVSFLRSFFSKKRPAGGIASDY
jgi:histidyl-tRNA synthetase